MICAEVIRRTIEEKHLNGAAVARASGITPQQLSHVMRGDCLLKETLVVPLCKALDITPNELFDYTKSDSPGEEVAREVAKAFTREASEHSHSLSRLV